MSDIPPITPNGAAAGSVAGRKVHVPATGSPPRAADSLEVSPAAQLLAKLAEMPEVRTELVERVRQEIASGRYETPEKIEAAVEALAEELAGE